MHKKLQSREGKVIGIDTSGAVRQLLTDVLRSKDFSNAQAVANVKEAIHILEVEAVDWIITPLLDDQDINGMQLLKLITQNKNLQNTRVSLILSEEEKLVIPTAFELGLMSYFAKPFNKDSLSTELDQTIKLLEENSWDTTMVSAAYLQKYLTEEKLYQDHIALNKKLISYYPGNGRLLLDLVTPQFNIGNQQIALMTLRQAQLLDSSLEKDALKLQQELFPNDESQTKEGEEAKLNVLGITTCVIIDSDDASRKAMRETLEQLGVEKIEDFDTGDAAWAFLDKEEQQPDLLIQEWRIPKITGPLMVQRIRTKFPTIPIIVFSSLLTIDDKPLVREMGVADVIKKPFERTSFLGSVVHTVQQDRLPTELETLERKIHQLLEAGQTKEALALKSQYKGEEIPEGNLAKIEAEFAYMRGEFIKARDFAAKAISSLNDSIGVLNFLGKCFMQLGDYQSALKCLEKAQTMSPKNIQRLCAIAEVNTELGDTEGAAEALQQAKDIDSDSSPIVETEAKIALSTGDVEKANKLMSQLDSIMSIIAYSNNKAIAHSRSGDVDTGIELYKKTIESIPESKKNLIPLVEYNLALAHTRADDLDQAISQLEKVINLGQTKVLSKANSLLKRIKKAIEKGTKVDLKSSPKVYNGLSDLKEAKEAKEERESSEEGSSHEALIPAENQALVAHVETNAGDLCCFQIYKSSSHTPESVARMLEKVPHFTKRETIEKEVSHGADKQMKAM